MVRGAAALLFSASACLDSPLSATAPKDGGGDAAPSPIADAGFGECTGVPLSALVDDFDDSSLPNWVVFSSDPAACRFTWVEDDVTVVNAGESETCGLRSKSGYDLTSEATWLKIDDQVRPTGDPVIEFRVYLESRYLVFALESGALAAGQCTDLGCSLASPVDIGQLQYWRFRHDDTARLVFAEASSNGTNWTGLAEVGDADVDCAHLEVVSRDNPPGENAPAVLDGVNVE